MASIEAWLPVVGWEGLYEVSDQGRVRSLPRTVAFGNRTRVAPSRILKPGRDLHGVLYVHLANGERRKVLRVHKLVLEAFVGPCPEGMEGCHYDDDNENNRLFNLRWDTRSANQYDQVRNGKHANARKTHCKWGHEYTPENTKVGKNGGRWCRECKRLEGRRTYQTDIENQRAYKREQMRRHRAHASAEGR